MESLYQGLVSTTTTTNRGERVYGQKILQNSSQSDLVTELTYCLTHYRASNWVTVTNIVNLWDCIHSREEVHSQLSETQQYRLCTCLKHRKRYLEVLFSRPSRSFASPLWGRVTLIKAKDEMYYFANGENK